LEKILEERALTRAQEILRPISHSMTLEAQTVEKAAAEKQIQLIAQELLEGPRRKLW
jgi:hypothetical protein